MWVYIVGGFVAVTVLPAAARACFRLIRPKLRGVSGELEVNRCLRKFKGKNFARERDIMIPSRGKTAQIDNLLVSPHGIFVIETKNYAGIIKGDERWRNWVQILPGSRQKPREFFNPIWQNNGHIKALRELLGSSYPGLRYHNIVVFSNECKLPRIPGVVTFNELNKTLKNMMIGPSVLSSDDIVAIKETIEKSNITDKGKRAEHVAFAKNAASYSKQREKDEMLRLRAVANKDIAMSVQQAYSLGRLGLDDSTSFSEPLDEKIRLAENYSREFVRGADEKLKDIEI